MNTVPRPAPAPNRGIALGLGAYFIWGLLPLYFALLAPAQGVEIVAARVVFSLIFCGILITVTRSWADVKYIVSDPRSMRNLFGASLLIATNWLLYVFAVMSHHSLEASLGYFINPIIPVLLGVIFLHEKLRRAQWAAVALGFLAVVVLTVGYGKLPIVSLGLALTFGIYGYLKNGLRKGTTAVASLTMETVFLTPIALVALILPAAGIGVAVFGRPTLFHEGAGHFWLMALSGIVTAVPLILFGAAASRLPLSVVGMLQYVAPVMQFLVGWLIFHEEMPPARWAGFGLIWLALIVLMVDAGASHRRRQTA